MSKLIVITAEELETIFDARLKIALEKYGPQTHRQPDTIPGQAAPTYVSKKEAARMLGCSQGTVDNFARAGKLRRSYLGKSVRFERAQVLGLTSLHHNSKQ